MLWTPNGEFQASISNFSGRPAATMGAAITPGTSNVKSAYVELLDGAVNTFDTYGIYININGNGASSNARDSLYDIGIDPADGSSFTVLIADLLGSCAGAFQASNQDIGGIAYYFPIFIPAAAQLGVRASVNNANNVASKVYVRLFGKPKRPELIRVGRFVTSFGATAASSSGTSVTSGDVSEGAWTDISGADTTTPLWWWQTGFGINDAFMQDINYSMDLAVGDGSNKQVVIEDQWISTGSSERVSTFPPMGGGYYEAPAGVRPYGRIQCAGTQDSNLSMMAYAVGG